MRLNAVLILAMAAASRAATFTNPVVSENSPDPGVIFHDGQFVAVTTGGTNDGIFPVHVSKDLVTWTQQGYVFPGPPNASAPAWTDGNPGFFWAPEIHELPDGTFALIYCARAHGAVPTQHSIAVAVAASPLGPWKSPLPGPLLTHPDPIGVIDATLYIEDSRVFLVYKRDANAVGKLTQIMALELAPDALSIRSPAPWELIRTDQAWEGVLVEAPWVVRRSDALYLFYSGSGGDRYAIGVARAGNITDAGWTKLGPPIVAADNATGWDIVGPGHCSVLQLPAAEGESEGAWMSWFHTWTGHQRRYDFSEPRRITQAQIVWDAATGWPALATGGVRPPVGPQPVPPF